MLVCQLFADTGIYLRPLADRMHSQFSLWEKMINRMGAVIASPDSCRELMAHGEHVLVYPGGAREVFKTRSELNQPVWTGRNGFARMAIENGYPIIPIASFGGDDAYRFILDSQEMDKSGVGQLLRKAGITQRFLRDGELMPPLVRGIGLSLMPRPQPFTVKLGKPIETAHLEVNDNDIEAVKTATQAAITKQLRELCIAHNESQSRDSLRYLINRYS